MLKKIWGILILCLLISSCLQNQRGNYVERQISVSGESKVFVTPDKIVLSFGVETKNKDLSIAKENNNKVVTKTIKTLKDFGIGESEIQTDRLQIEPRYDNYEKDEFLYYVISNNLVVTLDKPELAEDVISKILESGINQIQYINFQTTELKKYREQAREMALIAAKEKAEKMAAVLGQEIGSPLSITEGYSGGIAYGAMQTQNSMMDLSARGGSQGETISLGKIPISANVSVSFQLK